MERFTIKKNHFLERNIKAFYHEKYIGQKRHTDKGTIENLIVTFKNDYKEHICSYKFKVLIKELIQILKKDLPIIYLEGGFTGNVCVVTVPRSKANFGPEQLLLYSTISDTVDSLGAPFINATDSITRVKDTATTHKANWKNFVDNGPMPYKGITRDTCKINNVISGKNVILIDDLYTPGRNIDEDALQTLIDKGVANIVFYSLGAIV